MERVRIEGQVVGGRRLGRRLGFPTANLKAELPPSIAEGVYAALARVGGRRYGAMVNIGRSPTVDAGGPCRVEAHLLGFEGELYGARMEIELLERVRGEERFADLAALARQIERDRARIEAILEAKGGE